MPKKPLTKAGIEAIDKKRIEAFEGSASEGFHLPSKPRSHSDGKVPGLALICYPTGKKTWSLFFRFYGRPRRIKIGQFPILSVDEAREIARDHLNSATKGRDPVTEKKATKNAPTMADLVVIFEATHLPRLRESTQADYKGVIRRWIVPEIGKKRICDLTKHEVRRLHLRVSQKIAKAKGDAASRENGGYRRANLVLAVLSKMFSLAMEFGYTNENPCAGIERNPESARARYLSSDEIARLMGVLDRRADRASDAIRLLLLTGARRGEVLGAEWSQFDLDAGVWTKPMSLVKTKRLHRVPLSGPAVEVLRTMHERAGESPYLFPGPKGAPQRGLKTAWRAIRMDASIADVRIHDLRHSFASILVNTGASLPLIGSLLGHTEAQTTMRYSHLYDSVMKDATEKVGAAVNAAVSNGIAKKSKLAA